MALRPGPSWAFPTILPRFSDIRTLFPGSARVHLAAVEPRSCLKRPSAWRVVRLRADHRCYPRVLRPFRRVPPSSRYRLGQAQPSNALQDRPQQPLARGDLRHLEEHAPPVRHHLRRDLDEFLSKRGQRPVPTACCAANGHDFGRTATLPEYSNLIVKQTPLPRLAIPVKKGDPYLKYTNRNK